MKHQLPSRGTSKARTRQIYQKLAEARLEGWTGQCPALMRRKFLLPSTCNAGSAFHLWHLLCSLEETFFSTTQSMMDSQENYGRDVRDRESSKFFIIPRDVLRFHLRLANIWQLQIKTRKVKVCEVMLKVILMRNPRQSQISGWSDFLPFRASCFFKGPWIACALRLPVIQSSLDVAVTEDPAAAAAQAGKRQCLHRQRREGPGEVHSPKSPSSFVHYLILRCSPGRSVAPALQTPNRSIRMTLCSVHCVPRSVSFQSGGLFLLWSSDGQFGALRF